jgi:hypothetical protein
MRAATPQWDRVERGGLNGSTNGFLGSGMMTTSFSDAGNAASWKQDGKTVHQLSQYFLLHIIWNGGRQREADSRGSRQEPTSALIR